jgi:hypothetical protein
VLELGFKGAWMKRAVANHVNEKGGGQAVWEFGKLIFHLAVPSSSLQNPLIMVFPVRRECYGRSHFMLL